MPKEQKIDYLEKRKRIVEILNFTDKQWAEFKIRLKYDGIKQWEFFHGAIEAYLNADENLQDFLEGGI